MKKISRFTLLGFTFSVTIFLYQNCGQEGKIFSECTTSNCSLASLNDLSIDTSFVTPAIPNGGTLTVGVNQTQETTSSNTYKNIQLQGLCETAGFERHQIRWSITCDGECNTLRPNRGSAQCDSSGTYFISEYVRGLRTDNRAFYSLNLEIIALDEFDNPLYGGANSERRFFLNPVNVIRAPTLFNFSGTPTPITQPIIVVNDEFPFTGFCDRSTPPSGQDGNTWVENIIRLRFELPGTSLTIGDGIIRATQPNSDAIICQNVNEAGTIIANAAQANGNRNGFFQYTYPNLTSWGVQAPGFNCTNCIKTTYSRLLQLSANQTDRVGSETVQIKTNQLYLFKNSNFNGGKGWTAETLYEIGLRIQRTLSFSTVITTALGQVDVDYLSAIMAPNPRVFDARDDQPQNGQEQTVFESDSLRRFVLFKLGAHQEFGRRFAPQVPHDTEIQAFAGGNNYGNRLKELATNPSFCGFSEATFADPVGGDSQDVEMERLALCFTRFFYLGMHGDSIDATRDITTKGLNLSGSCTYKSDGTAAAPKYCEKVRELLSNTVQGADDKIPLLANATITRPNRVIPATLNSLPGLKNKFIPSTSLANVNVSDKRFEFFTNAVVQLWTNSIMREVTRHLSGGVANSYFMRNVLDTVYGRFLPASMTEQQKIALYNQMSPAEVNYTNGTNNFSAYTSRPEVGSLNAVGSIICEIPANNPNQCNN